MTLYAYQNEQLVGSLEMEPRDPFYRFTYDPAYLASPLACELSQSLPLREESFTFSETLPYFEGLLPEGDIRKSLARQFHISAQSPAQILEALGEDCAGDVVIVGEQDLGMSLSQGEYVLIPNVIEAIQTFPAREIANLRAEYRLSLAGGQEKIALYHNDDLPLAQGWYAPVHGLPSSHILKPEILSNYPKLVLNEFLCMRAAAHLGFDTAEVQIIPGDHDILVVRRYDRIHKVEGSAEGGAVLQRLHQEDFCQALGMISAKKYERSGSSYLKKVSGIISRTASNPARSMNQFLKILLFNYAIGNCDAHLKNYSLLRAINGSVTLAPAYDLLSTTIYDGSYGAKLERKMGMSLGDHLVIDRVTSKDLLQTAQVLRQSPIKLAEICSHIEGEIVQAFMQAAEDAKEVGVADAQELAEWIVADMADRRKILREVS